MKSARFFVALTSLVILAVFIGAPSVWAADCPDPDGDDYVVVSGGCTVPSGKFPGDCDESDAGRNPGATEVCSETVKKDENCDGIDPFLIAGEDCTHIETNAFGTCGTTGTNKCTTSTTMSCELIRPGVCVTDKCNDVAQTACTTDADCPEVNVSADVASSEALAAGDISCFDGVDNDCDGDVDNDGELDEDQDGVTDATVSPDANCVVASEQFCNGFDDDNDGSIDNDMFGVGNPCTEGIGACARTGSVICQPGDATQLLATCSVGEGIPQPEDTPGVSNCIDGIDNDCDGDIDLADASCQEPELCDGVDNDGNGLIDENVADLEATCTVGVGACEVTGEKVCNVAGDDTVCNVSALLPETEGPSGATCQDLVDNDCDGLTDDNDPDCASAGLAVTCALPRTHGRRSQDCNSTHRVEFSVFGDNGQAQVTAEFLAFDEDGTLLGTLPGVQPGDRAQLASRIDPADFYLFSKQTRRGGRHDVFAPVPVLHVKANTGQNVEHAYCSPIPFLGVIEPTGADQVVSAAEGDRFDVLVAIPRVSPETLEVVVDGEFIFDAAHLNINPATVFPNATPLAGDIDIRGKTVTVSDLVAQTAPDLNTPGSNVLKMTLENLGPGGHIVVINGEPQPDGLPTNPTPDCHIDDVLDAGTSSVFGIIIDAPAENATVPGPDTNVTGTVIHGRDITSVNVGGKPKALPLGQTCSALEFTVFGEDFSVDTCEVVFDETLPQSNLNNLALGTIDLGRNQLTVQAQDDLLNRTYAQRGFILGADSTTSPSIVALPPMTQAAMERAIEQKLKQGFADLPPGVRPLDVTATINGVALDLAFTFGVRSAGLTDYFQSVCQKAQNNVKQKVDEALSNAQLGTVTVPGGASCDVTAGITGLNVQIPPPGGDDIECSVISTGVSGQNPSDKIEVTVTLPDILFSINVFGRCKKKFLGVCISETIVNVNLNAGLNDFGVKFGLNEDLVRVGGDAPADFIDGSINIAAPGSGVDFNCITGFFNDVANFFTFGLVNFEDIASNAIQNALTVDIDISEAIRAKSTDPVNVKKIEVNEDIVAADELEIQQDLSTIDITNTGFTGTIGASFVVPLPESSEGGEATVTPAAAPTPDILNPINRDLFFATSDDIFNLLFAAVNLKGALMTSCVQPEVSPGVPVTVDAILPTDCDALTDPNPITQNVMRGKCHGAKGTDCSTLPPLTGQMLQCNLTQTQLANKNISKDTPLLFCANNPVAPRTLIKDLVPTPALVEAQLHTNDTKITIMLDRNASGGLDAGQNFLTAPKCFAGLQDATKDCRWSDACFDLNLDANFTLADSPDGDPQIVRNVTGVDDSVGLQCGGLFDLGDDSNLLTESGSSDPIDIIQTNIQDIVRLFEAEGLKLGGLVNLPNRILIAIDTAPMGADDCTDCAEYVGVAGDLVPVP